MGLILRCTACGAYTLREVCPSCGARAASPHPPRYSPEDRWGAYRRRAKAERMAEEKKQG